ncbi:MAG: hypothetical protein EOM54_08955 [Clostridia bacterium]|nr:hypothetical protein [Clostridia bacterium]
MFEAMYGWRLRFRKSAFMKMIAGYPKEEQEAEACVPIRETCGAVKGVSRRVVIVSEPDPNVFEEAIFVVREDYMNGGGIGASELLREAKTAAGGYIETALGRPSRRTYPGLRAAVCIAAGIALTVAVWFILQWFGGV